MTRHTKHVMPVRVRGMDFPSAQACAEYFGIRPQTVYNAVAAGRADMIGLGPGNHNGPRRGGRIAPFRIGPFTFASQAQAGEALGVSRSYISAALRGKGGCSMERLMHRAMQMARNLDAAAREKT